MLRRRCIALLALALCGCGGASRVGASSGDPHVLTFLNPIDDKQEATLFATEVERLSKGRLRIRVMPSSHLRQTDGEAAAIRDVRSGRYDLGWAGSRAWPGSLRALGAPLLVDSYALEERIAKDAVAKRMLDGVRASGVVGLGIVPGPIRRPLGLGRRLAAPSDFRGLAIGEARSPVADATLRALGADPVAVPVELDPRRLDGLEAPAAAVYGRHLDGTGAHMTGNVSLWPRPVVFFANDAAFVKLTDDEREILRAAARSAIPKAAEAQRSNEAEAAANLCRSHRLAFDTASPADLRALRAAVAPVYRDLERDPATRDAIAEIAAIKRELGAPPADLPACHAPAAPHEPARTPLDGAWQMDSGRAASGPDLLDENWGHWIFVFERGRFAITQENRTSCTWGYGTYTVHGDRTTWLFTDGGGDAPNDAANKPGEEFAFRVSLFRDTATLGPVKGAVSPVNFDAKPWRKLGPPLRSRLSRRCPPSATALRP